MPLNVVEKHWGREVWHANNELYCLKELHVSAGWRCSFHRHPVKDETFILQRGDLLLRTDHGTSMLGPDEAVRLRPGDFHSFRAVTDALILEASTTHRDSDVDRQDNTRFVGRLFDEREIHALANAWADRKERIVFTNGCFDGLHPGHLNLLREAAGRGERLIVAVNSDASVRRLKGADRPIFPDTHRAGLIAALDFVDAVVIFEEDTPERLVETIRPSVLIKGADSFQAGPVPGAKFVETNGGEVVPATYWPGWSTSRLMEDRRRPARCRGRGDREEPD